jgi:hypothetical protein
VIDDEVKEEKTWEQKLLEEESNNDGKEKLRILC